MARTLAEALSDRGPSPCTIVIFGASGDLTSRKLMPALFALFSRGFLPGGMRIVGTSRRPWSRPEFEERMAAALEKHSHTEASPEHRRAFLDSLDFVSSNAREEGGLAALREKLESPGFPPDRLFYLATPPTEFGPIAAALGRAGLVHPNAVGTPWTRLIVEKPFGRDLRSARELNRELQAVFSEDQIYRIDHYLGKETVQNILVFRFANAIYEPVWNNRYVDHVQITVAESIGVGSRGAYYDRSGALRDMVQNHILQVLSLVAMEPPSAFRAESVRVEKLKVLDSLRPVEPEAVSQRVVRGQYGRGRFLGEELPAYREEPGVAPDSATETFVALKMFIDNWRWAGVPFYIRTGKRLPRKVSEVSIHFKQVPHALFGRSGPPGANMLALRIQPDEGISLLFEAKVPGVKVRLRPVKMSFDYGGSFGGPLPDAYERLLLDAVSGDKTLFIHEEEAYRSWEFLEGIMEGWRREGPPPFPNYAAGTWGPQEAEELLARDGRKWRKL